MWLLVAVFLLITFFQYSEHLGGPTWIVNLTENLGLTRFTVERILYLVPIVWAALLLGRRGAAIVSLTAVACMLPRAIFDSPHPEDALIETAAVFIVGNLVGFSLESLRMEQQRRAELEEAQGELQSHVQTIEENERRLAALNQTSTIISQSLELDDVLNNAISCVIDVIAADAVRIYTLDENNRKLHLAAHRGVSDEFAQSMKEMNVGEGFNGRVAETGEPLFVEDATKDPRLTRMIVRKENIRSQIIVPMVAKGKVVGTLAVAMHTHRQFLPEEVDLITAVANQIGVAVDNASLYQQQKQVAEQLRTSEERYRELFENAHDAIWLHDLEGNLIAANRACARLTGYTVEELRKLQISDLLSNDSLETIQNAEQQLIKGDAIGSLAQANLKKKDGMKIIVQLALSLVSDNHRPTGFQYIAHDLTSEKQLQENLRFLLQQVTRAQEEERKRIAQELHDDTVQALVIHCQQIDHVISDIKGLPKQAKSRLGKLHDDAAGIMQDVRRLSQDLRPAALDNLGLAPALRWLGSDVASYSGIKIDVEVLGIARELPDEAEVVLFRIAQEALRNVWKHAEATTTKITLEFLADKTMITVTDDGKGFDPENEKGDLAQHSKLGLAGMQERTQLFAGTLRVSSRPGEGTTLIAELPV